MAAPKGNQYAKGMTKAICNAGAPEKYTQEWCEKEAAALLEWIRTDSDDPNKKVYLGSFASERGYHRNRFKEFCQKSNVFACAYQQAQIWQESKFVSNGLNRKWDAAFTQYVMARVCAPEWRKSWDKVEDKEEDKQPIIVVNKIYKNQLEEKEEIDDTNSL